VPLNNPAFIIKMRYKTATRPQPFRLCNICAVKSS
jgi:hypothetical protein